MTLLNPITIGAPLILIAVALGTWWLAGHDLLYREAGILETASASLFGLCFLLSVWTLLRAASHPARYLAAWLAVVSLLAGLRELDAHIYLNPQTLGSLGVRYKVSWWLDGSVPLWLKLGWSTVFLAVAAAFTYPLLKSRRELLRLMVNRDPRFIAFWIAIGFLGMGFVFDDLLRNTTLMTIQVRQLLEETTELIGAYCFLVLVIWHKRMSPAHNPIPATPHN